MKKAGFGTAPHLLSRKILFMALIAALASGGVALTSNSASAVEIDICEEVITEILIPPIPQISWECKPGFHCLVLPHCCIPGLCNLDPLCNATNKIVGWTQASLQERVTLECRVVNINPKDELLNWLRGSVASLDDVIVPFVKEAVRIEINVAKLSASQIPAPVRDALNELTLPHRNSGQSKFRSIDILNARIISGANPLVSEYLREEKGFDAITLGDLIVIEDGLFQVLMDSSKYATASQLRGGTANCVFRKALLLLAHELVHIRQYADLGFDTFMINYLIETLAVGYGSDSFETEAYGYSSYSKNPTTSPSGLFGAPIQTCGVSTTPSPPSGVAWFADSPGPPRGVSTTPSTPSGLAGTPQLTLSGPGAVYVPLTGAADAAQKNLRACLDRRGAVPKTCFEQVKGYYPVTPAERAKLLTRVGKAPPKLRHDYYFKTANGRLTKVITNEKLSRDDVLNRMCNKPVFKPGPLVPPNIRIPKPPIRPLGLKPVINLPPAPVMATQPPPIPVNPMTIQPTPAPVRPMTIQPTPAPVRPMTIQPTPAPVRPMTIQSPLKSAE
jgi:hypothetical protein